MFDEEIQRALKWLMSMQSSIGGWSGPFPDREWSGAWTTAGVVLAYLETKGDINTSIKTALSWLISQQNDDGSWPRIQSDIGSVESTAWSLMAIAKSAPSSASIGSTALRRGILWLLDVQIPGEGWDYHSVPEGASRVIPTSFVILALVRLVESSDDLGERLRESIRVASSWLLSLQRKDGSWTNVKEDKANSASTAFALLALSKVRHLYKSIKQDVLEHAQKWLVSHQMDNGSWPLFKERVLYTTYSSARVDEKPVVFLRDIYWDWFSTPWVLASLVSSGADIASDTIQKGLGYLLDLQTQEGGWQYSEESFPMFWSTYQAIFCLNLLTGHIDARSVYRVFEARLKARDELIRQLHSDPNIADEYGLLVYEMKISRPIVLGFQKGFYTSQRVIIFSLIVGSLLLLATILSLLFPSTVYYVLDALRRRHFKFIVSVMFLLYGTFALLALRKITKMSRENFYASLFGFIIGLIFYLLS